MDGAAIASESRLASAGSGSATLALCNGRTQVVRSCSRSPLKLLSPRTKSKAASLFVSTFGGGLVAGDRIDLQVDVQSGASGIISTQSATKVFRSIMGVSCRQALNATLANDSLLVCWPDPVIAFAGANYEQVQRFDLVDSAALVLVDWQTSGRVARGERWAFSRSLVRNQVFIDGKCVLADALLLDEGDGAIDGLYRAGRFDCIASIVVIGARLAEMTDALVAAIAGMPLDCYGSRLATASRIAAGAVVRILGPDAQTVGRLIRRHLSFVHELLGHDPWARKW